MKYYLIEIADGDNKITAKGVYEYNTKNEAMANFHKKLGTAMGSELYTSELIMVVSEDGNLIAIEKYVAEPKEVTEE